MTIVLPPDRAIDDAHIYGLTDPAGRDFRLVRDEIEWQWKLGIVAAVPLKFHVRMIQLMIGDKCHASVYTVPSRLMERADA